MSAENEQLVRRAWEEIFNRQNLEAVDEFYAADVAYHGPDGDFNSVDAVRQVVEGYLTAFPDSTVTVEEVISSGDQVVSRLTGRGTQTGPLGDFPPSGKSVELAMTSFVRIESGKVVEEWITFDRLGMMQQIGAIPAEAEA